MTDLAGKQLGSWRIWQKVDSEGRGAWLVRCLKCNRIFTKDTRSLTRRKRMPYGCKGCNWAKGNKGE